MQFDFYFSAKPDVFVAVAAGADVVALNLPEGTAPLQACVNEANRTTFKGGDARIIAAIRANGFALIRTDGGTWHLIE